MTSDRIDELLKGTAYPESVSVRQAMLQVWNEMQQDFNSRTCENCKYSFNEGGLYCDYPNGLQETSSFMKCNKWEAKDAK